MNAPKQLALFDTASRAPSRDAHAYHQRLSELAFCYTATSKGNNSGIRFMMSLDHAQQWCESPESCGSMHGTSWSYFYTTVRNFISDSGMRALRRAGS